MDAGGVVEVLVAQLEAAADQCNAQAYCTLITDALISAGRVVAEVSKVGGVKRGRRGFLDAHYVASDLMSASMELTRAPRPT
jgi:hypothetical protein